MGDGAGFVGIRFCQVSWPLSTIDYFVKASLESLLFLTSILVLYFTSKNTDITKPLIVQTSERNKHNAMLQRTDPGTKANLVPGAVFSHLMLEMDFTYFHCFS